MIFDTQHKTEKSNHLVLVVIRLFDVNVQFTKSHMLQVQIHIYSTKQIGIHDKRLQIEPHVHLGKIILE